MNQIYKDVNENNILLYGEMEAGIQVNGETVMMPLFFNNRNTHPVLGLDWIKQLNIEVNENTLGLIKNEELFQTNTTIKGITADINLKPGASLLQDYIHLQFSADKEMKYWKNHAIWKR